MSDCPPPSSSATIQEMFCMSKRTLFLVTIVVVLTALASSACGGGGGAAPQAQGDAKAGAQAWAAAPCVACHGANAEGGAGPKLAGTSRSFDQVKAAVRNGRGGEMPKFSADQISDQTLTDIYAWLKSK
jgi:mono/diheme cytochrome c family protein